MERKIVAVPEASFQIAAFAAALAKNLHIQPHSQIKLQICEKNGNKHVCSVSLYEFYVNAMVM